MKYFVIFLMVITAAAHAQIDEVYRKKLGIKEHTKKSNENILFMNVIGLNAAEVSDHSQFDWGPGLNYSPNLNFKLANMVSLCAGSNLTIAFGSGLLLSAPAYLGINLGCGANKMEDWRLGGFCNVGISSITGTDGNIRYAGFYFDLGVRFDLYGFCSELRVSQCDQPGFGSGHFFALSYGIVFGRYRM
jgi:hypothetical protein